DPLWTMVSGLAWIVPFAVVAFSPLRRDTILVRCAVFASCAIVLLLSGALEYVYSLSQYTARVQTYCNARGFLYSHRLFSSRISQNTSTGHECLAGRLEFGCCR